MQQFFSDEEFQFGLELTLGSAYHHMADAGEALVTAGRIADGNSDSWVAEWTEGHVREMSGVTFREAVRRLPEDDAERLARLR